MTILLHDHFEFEESSNKLKAWKAWHIILFICAAVFGLANYIFLYKTMELVDNHCVFYPIQLEFKTVQILSDDAPGNYTEDAQSYDSVTNTTNEEGNRDKRDIADNKTTVFNETHEEDDNMFENGNLTHRVFLNTDRTLFQPDTSSHCQFAEYMPLLSTVFACVWVTMFTICAGGGRARSGLSQPWRILAPALIFAVVMVGLTGHSFTITNGGLHAFCSAFQNVTNSTKCSSVEPWLEASEDASWGFGGRAAAARAASAGVWAAWACAAALLLARCLAAPDFVLKRTDVYLAHDPHQKIIPHLLKNSKFSSLAHKTTMGKRENASVRSEPTITTELVTASVEHEPDSNPTSLIMTPEKMQRDENNVETAELSYMRP